MCKSVISRIIDVENPLSLRIECHQSRAEPNTGGASVDPEGDTKVLYSLIEKHLSSAMASRFVPLTLPSSLQAEQYSHLAERLTRKSSVFILLRIRNDVPAQKSPRRVSRVMIAGCLKLDDSDATRLHIKRPLSARSTSAIQ